MLIVDFSSVMIANLHAQVGLQNVKVVEEDLLRHMILNTIRAIRVKFKKHEMVIACDRGSWRKKFYPYYKANRKKQKDKSDLNWPAIFECFTRMREDLKAYFPYRVVEVEGCEADDIIGTLVREFSGDEDTDLPLAIPGEGAPEIIIVSPDKDFAQLHVFKGVKQWNPIKKEWVTHKDPVGFLKEHIIRGDSVDGVPNVMSDDDTFVVEGKRQKTMTQKRFDELMKTIPVELSSNYERNKMMIDLTETPFSLQDDILEAYEAEAGKGRSQLFNYFIKNRLKNLLESINEF